MEITILDVQWEEAAYNGKPITLLAGHMAYKGSLQLLVDRIPKLADFTFKRYGNFLFAEIDGFVRIFKYVPGSTKGFDGREYTLRFDNGSTQTFKGNLWDPTGFDRELLTKAHIPEYRAVSITAEKEVMEKGRTFYAGYVTKELYDELMSMVILVSESKP